MSSYLSSEYKIQQPVSSFNVNLADNVISTLQGKYDTNKAKIDQTLAVYNNQLRGLRAEDNEYIANRLNEVDSVIEQYKKKNGNLAYNSTTDTILSTVKSLMDDPIIKDAVKNKAYFDNYEKQVQEIKKKNPEKYSDINYQDGLKQGGYYSYLKGESKGIGNLQYQEYTNAPKEISDAVGKWAKENGYEQQITTENKGLYFINKTHEVLSQDKILNYIDTIVDPKTRAQMDINARASYGALKDEDFNKLAKGRYEQENTKDSSTIAEQRALLKTASKEQATTIESNIAFLESRKKERTDKISVGKYDRNDQYTFYKNDIYGNVADAYDRDNVTKIDYNTTELDIAKFKFDAAYKTEDLRLKKEANKIASGVSDGTAIPVIPEKTPTPESNITQVKTAFTQSEADLKNILAKEDPEYKKLQSLGERNDYVRAIMKTGGVINMKSKSPLSSNILVAINNHKNNYEAYGTYINSAKGDLDNVAKNQYEDMAGAKDLNLNNLGSSMPFTADALKGKKKFSSLRPEEQEMVRYERALSQIQFDDILSEDEKNVTKTYLNHIKARNSGNKWFQNNIKSLGNAEEIGDSLKNFWTSGVYGVAIKGVKNVLDEGANILKYTYGNTFGSGADAQAEYIQSKKENTQDWQDIATNYKNVKKSTLDSSIIGALYQDTNMTEVDTKSDSRTGRDLSSTYRASLTTSVDRANSELGKFLPKIAEKQSFSFSTANKAQTAMALQLGQLVQKNGGDVPDKGENNYNLEYFAQNNAFKISYLDSDGKLKTTDFIDRNLVPKNIANKYQTSLSNWSTDLKNPKATIPSVQYERPVNRKEGEDMIETLAKTNPGVFTEQELYMLMDSPMFQAPTIMYDNIYKAHPEVKGNAEKERKIDAVMNATVKTRTRRYGESTFQIQTIFTDQSGREIGVSGWEAIGDYDPQNNLKIQMAKIAKDFNNQINAIVQ